MNGVTLDYRKPAAPFSLAAGQCRVDGTLLLRINEAPDVSTVYLDGVFQGPPDASLCSVAAPSAPPVEARSFRGDLVQWRSPVRMVLLRDRHLLTANVAVQVDVVAGRGGQAVDLSFFNADQLVWSVPVTHYEIVTLKDDLVSGQTTIRKGAQFTMNPPSSVSGGNLVVQNLWIVTGTTSVDASGTLLSWPAPPAGPPPGGPTSASPAMPPPVPAAAR